MIFLFNTSRATGFGMLVHSALTSKETVVSSELMIFSFEALSYFFAIFNKGEVFDSVHLQNSCEEF